MPIAGHCPQENTSDPETLGFITMGVTGDASSHSSIKFWQCIVFSKIISIETNSHDHLKVSRMCNVVLPLHVLMYTNMSSFGIRLSFIQSFIQKQMFSEALLCARYLLLSFFK